MKELKNKLLKKISASMSVGKIEMESGVELMDTIIKGFDEIEGRILISESSNRIIFKSREDFLNIPPNTDVTIPSSKTVTKPKKTYTILSTKDKKLLRKAYKDNKDQYTHKGKLVAILAKDIV